MVQNIQIIKHINRLDTDSAYKMFKYGQIYDKFLETNTVLNLITHKIMITGQSWRNAMSSPLRRKISWPPREPLLTIVFYYKVNYVQLHLPHPSLKLKDLGVCQEVLFIPLFKCVEEGQEWRTGLKEVRNLFLRHLRSNQLSLFEQRFAILLLINYVCSLFPHDLLELY